MYGKAFRFPKRLKMLLWLQKIGVDSVEHESRKDPKKGTISMSTLVIACFHTSQNEFSHRK